MFTKSLIIFLAFTAVVLSHDISVGTNNNGRKIFDETKQASPAIWRQTNNVTVKANDDEVISRVVVKDLRAEKDGEAKIVEGGEGQKNVTIELKSPTALRGYEFQIEVYAVPDMNKEKSPPQNDMEVNMDGMANHPKDTGFNMEKTTNMNVPTVVSKDDTNRSTRNANEDNKNQQPGIKIPFPNNDYSTIKPEDCSTEMPLEDILNKENMKTAKDAQEHEIVDFVLDMNDSAKEALMDGQSMASDMTPMGLKSNSTEEKERLSRDASTTESSDIESTTSNESTVIPEAEEESKDDKLKPINKEFLYSKHWNGQNNEDLPKVPFVSTRDESNTKMKDSDSKNVKLHLK